MHDILIRGGLVVDGTGSPPKPLDVAIDGTKIAGFYKRSESKASLTIEAKDMIVCPGFVDIHSHSEISLLSNPLAESKIRQGVTTELIGNCGTSPAPAIGNARDELAHSSAVRDVRVDWTTLDEYLLRLQSLQPSVNVASLVGADTLRRCVIGPSNVPATAGQLGTMRQLLADSMLQGAFGLSSGLIYAPGCFASTEELIALASTAASLGGIYTSHIRGEGRTLEKAVAEAIRIGREARVRVQISHHKACSPANWGKVKKTIAMIEIARAEGVDVSFDVYPYTASHTSLDSLLPPWAREGGREEIRSRLSDPVVRERIAEEMETPADDWEDTAADVGWEKIVVVGLRGSKNRQFENKSVKEIADAIGKPPAETAMDLMLDEDFLVYAIFHEMLEDDVMSVMKHPLAAIVSDAEAEAPYDKTGMSATHPRAYGTFPRVLRRYVFEKGLFPLEEAIRKMNSLPAQRIGLDDRGVLGKGMAADIVVFDPKTVRDRATFEEPHQYPDGIICVIVNGAVTIENGEHTGVRAGMVLRHRPTIA
ncbi:MAG: N-acyl-D-amino-acid deacylase family protein [Thermoplasmata archaeon]